MGFFPEGAGVLAENLAFDGVDLGTDRQAKDFKGSRHGQLSI